MREVTPMSGGGAEPPDETGKLRSGELLVGRYRLKGLLGSGGMGDVYAADSLVLGREVAVKILREEHAREKRGVARFLREARAASKVNHTNVVHILDAGIDDTGVPFIVQELLSGEDLGTYLDRHGGRLGVDHTLDLMRPVIDAMAVAHAHRVVHRDLKPENIFLARNDDGVLIPKILDFGISKIADDASLEDRTQTGVIVGTPHYMAPEQIIGSREIDGRADVWALGVMLFELMTGDLPFGSRNDGRIFMRIALGEPTHLEAAVPGVSKDLAKIVQRCLRRNIGERYPSAAELARDLRLLREMTPIEPTQRIAAIDGNLLPAPIAPVESRGVSNPQSSTIEISVQDALRRLGDPSEAPPLEQPVASEPAHKPGSERRAAKPNAPTPREPQAAPQRLRTERPGLVAVALAFLLAALVVASAAMRRSASGSAANTTTAPRP